MTFFSMVMLPLFIVMCGMVGLLMGLRRRKLHAAERARWREAYRVSPDANLINLR